MFRLGIGGKVNVNKADYALAIHPGAEKEWAKLDGSIKCRFKEKLGKERRKLPHVVKDALRELPDCNKITTPSFVSSTASTMRGVC